MLDVAVSSRSRNGAPTLRRLGATDACGALSSECRARRRPLSSGNATRPTGIENDVEREGEGSEHGRRSKGAATLAQQFEKAPCDLSRSEVCRVSLLKLSLSFWVRSFVSR